MYFDDFKVGQKFYPEPITMTKEDIREFASRFDPLPIHLDPELAKDSIFHGIIASGFHTLSAVWGQFVKMNISGSEVIAGLGMDKISWKLPVYPNDTLRGEVEVTKLTPSSKAGRGIVIKEVTAFNQNDEIVLTFQTSTLMKRKA